MSNRRLRIFPARMDSLPQALAYVQASCRRNRVAQPDALRLTLVLEELFTNTVVHGHGGASEAAVRLAIGATATHLSLHFEDEAPPFDPLRHLAETVPQRDLPTEQRPVGGLGLPLVAELAERFEYERRGRRNCLRVLLRRTP
jgi:anti-sigma regulatory factor (Ser/Thr protein kinase)